MPQNKNKDLVYIVLLFLIICCLFLILPQKYFFKIDIYHQFFIFKKFIFENLFKGHSIFWNPYLFCGEPGLADIQFTCFYLPEFIIFLIIPFKYAYTVSFIFHFFFSALFLYLFVKNIIKDNFSAFFSCIILIFSGFYFFLLYCSQPSVLNVVSWYPALLYFYFRFFKTNNKKYLYINAFIFYLIITGGQIQFFLYAIILSFLYFAYYLHQNNFKSALKFIFIFIYSIILGVLLSSIQFIPSFIYAKYSAREGNISYRFLTNWSLHPLQLVTLTMPDFLGKSVNNTYLSQIWRKLVPWENISAYIGTIPFLLIFIFFFKKNKKLFEKYLIGGIIVSLILALGKYTPVYKILYYFPFIKYFRVPSRFLSLFILFSSVLSGMSFYYFFIKKESMSISVLNSIKYFFILILILTALLFIAQNPILNILKSKIIILYNKYSSGANSLSFYLLKINIIYKNIIIALLHFSISGIIFYICLIKRQKIYIKYLLIMIFIAETLFCFYPYLKTPGLDYPEKKFIKFLKSKSVKEQFRILPYDRNTEYFSRNEPLYFDIQTIRGYNPLHLKNYAEFMRKLETRFNDIYTNIPVSLPDISKEEFQLLNVKYIISKKNLSNDLLKKIYDDDVYKIYEYKNFLPFAWVFSRFKEKNKIDFSSIEKDKVKLIYNSNDKKILNVFTKNKKFLFVSMPYYPMLKIKVNNTERKIKPIENCFISVPLDKGNNFIKIYYSPIDFYIGFIITFLTCIYIISKLYKNSLSYK